MTNYLQTKTISTPVAPEADDGAAPLLGQLLLAAARQWRRTLDVQLSALDWSETSWVPFFHLCRGGDGICLKALAGRVGLDSSSLVRVIDALEERGLLVREPDPTDRRSKLLFITPEGRAAHERIRAHLAQAETHAFDGLPAGTVDALRSGLQALSAHLQLDRQAAATESCPTERT